MVICTPGTSGIRLTIIILTGLCIKKNLASIITSTVEINAPKKFVKKYEVKNDNGEVDKEKTESFKETAKNFQEHAGNLFPKITDENSSEVSKFGRVAGYNPSILKDGQEKNTYFVKM